MTPTNRYWTSVYRWARGFAHLDEVPLKPGWKNGPAWWAVYALDYGAACILLGLGVQPISRWAGQRVKHAPWGWLAWLLDRLDRGHTANAGGLLWATQPCEPHIRLAVVIAWVVVLGLTLI